MRRCLREGVGVRGLDRDRSSWSDELLPGHGRVSYFRGGLDFWVVGSTVRSGLNCAWWDQLSVVGSAIRGGVSYLLVGSVSHRITATSWSHPKKNLETGHT